MSASTIEITAAALFALAVLHTFSTPVFERLAHASARHAGLWHLLGEVEVVFGFWALVLVLVMGALSGRHDTIAYLEALNFTEPMFVFVIMVIAGTRPVLSLAGTCVHGLCRVLPVNPALGTYLVLLTLVPLLGSFITEPAAMTLAALMLRDRYFQPAASARLKYGTLGVLFVNISIGGTLTPFAAPPVLMVAGAWGWDFAFMLSHFGWKAMLLVAVNALGATLVLRRELSALPGSAEAPLPAVPAAVILVHLLFLGAVVVFAHHPVVFIGLLMFFLGFTTAYERHQDKLMLREGLLVAFFLAGLVVLGGQQRWWLQPLLLGMDANAVYLGAIGLTAITDNAALTYLGSLVDGLSPQFKLMLVAGAVTGGGLTVIANAPNPAGVSILRGRFEGGAISPLGLLVGAAAPTLVAALGFYFL
ncbi:MAG: putative Na+/H+ antiporter [Ideonella sp.]|nr:putative Na+/H+ antiporter [Ideonella sp.]MBL0147678.1 putative Na+/H+ antiporter [Ideonella sp.]